MTKFHNSWAHTFCPGIASFICLFLFAPQAILGQSVYSAAGIGDIRYFVTGRSSGMGGVGLASVDDIMYNVQNPAVNAFLQNTTMSSGFVFVGLRAAQKSTSFSNRLSRWNGLNFSIKFGDRVNVGGGIVPFSDFRYGMALADEGTGYRRSLQGEGGLTRGVLSAAVKIFPDLSVGLMYSRYFGVLQENFIVKYDDPGFAETNNSQRTEMWGNNLRIGGMYRKARYALGGYYALPSNLFGKSEFTLGTLLPTTISHFPAKIPGMWGIGSMFRLTRTWIAGMDVQGAMFKNMRIGNSIQKFENSYRLAAGGEYAPVAGENKGRFAKTRYQFGMYTDKLYVQDVNGSAVHEYGLTFGFGFPFNNYFSRIDLSLDLGIRGSKDINLVQERFMRIGLHIGARERWFEKRRDRGKEPGKSSEEPKDGKKAE